jgi:hypothetical protein
VWIGLLGANLAQVLVFKFPTVETHERGAKSRKGNNTSYTMQSVETVNES